MEKLPMCRLCLSENVRKYVVVNKELHELYERLTDNPFVTGDSRPMLACFICCTKLKQCCQLQRKCLEAEELLTQMMNEDYELEPFLNQDHFGCINGLMLSPIVHVSIESDDECQTESDAVKEELPAVCERLDDVNEPKEEYRSDELELENVYNSYSDITDIPEQQSESDSEDDVTLIEIKTEVEEQQLLRKKRRVSDTTRAVAETRNLHIRGSKLQDVITENQKKNKHKSGTIDTQNTRNCTSKLIPKTLETLSNTTPRVNKRTSEKPYKCKECQRCFSQKGNLTKHIRTHTGEKPYKCKVCQLCFSYKTSLSNHIRTHTGEKPYKCEECQLCFSHKTSLSNHIRTHTGDKPYKCEECQLCFSYKTSLSSHILTHTGEKPYKCEKCQLCFRHKSNLTTHIRTHTGEKPFKCERCQLCFNRKNLLTKHIRLHTGENPYKCEDCQRCFSEKRTLARHIFKHTGKKPYKCDICQSCFARKDVLTLHIHTHTDHKP